MPQEGNHLVYVKVATLKLGVSHIQRKIVGSFGKQDRIFIYLF